MIDGPLDIRYDLKIQVHTESSSPDHSSSPARHFFGANARVVYRIDFNRQTGLASHPGFGGIGGDYVAHGSDPYFDVARAMTDAGEPDGPAVFVDERGIACLTVKSLHSRARRYRPNDADKTAKKARAEARRCA